MDMLPIGAIAALIGLATGSVLGLAARLGDFCTLGAIESAVYGEDQTRLRLWGIVLGTAIFTTFLFSGAGLIDLSQTIYHSIAWNPLASIIGGLVFGYGMALAGNCGYGALVRFGGGDLRALVVVVVMGIFGFVALAGPLANLRVFLFPQTDAAVPMGMAELIHAQLGIPPLAFATLVAAAFVVWALSYEPLRQSPVQIGWGVAAGLSVSLAFWGTTALNQMTFGGVLVEGHSFTAPLGRTLLWLMTSTSGGLSFAVGSVAGVLGGSFLGSGIRGHFRWEACEDPRELGRQVSGAALMGIGGVIALGCSLGQGVSGFATLAYSAPVTLGAIYIGAVFGLRRLIQGFQPD
ncbi:YeeE/YedE family protein [Actibacterium sp. XHP0104]|uniref:YeeE/YedE family protein n=1 Tax=Actibacterium sp. XHP0104 TaxID=2984335 RepID=UPI0021E86A41|nr:YeeE/YedE family protein [Actibacterium sp. XHP0104]MCV2881467.1 YeeE/YedE family protein [Actibacterium sp. XHP0104]